MVRTVWAALLSTTLLLATSCAGLVERHQLRGLLPAQGALEDHALASKGAWVSASQALAGRPNVLENNVFAWAGMRDTLTAHEQAVLSVIDGDTSGGYWSTYEVRTDTRKGDDGEPHFYTARNSIEVTLPARIQISRVVIHTVEEPTATQATKVALEAYSLSYCNDYGDPPTWVPLATVGGNEELRRVHDFAPVNTWKIRLELSPRTYYGAGWVRDEATGERIHKLPKVSEIQAYGIPVGTDETPPPRPALEVPAPPREKREILYFISSGGDTTLIDPKKLTPVGKDSLAKLAQAREARRKDGEKQKSEVFVLDPRGDVVDEATGAARFLPQIDLINARCFLEGDNYSFSLTVAGKLVGKGGKLLGRQCVYGFELDLDGDGRFDLECRRSSYSYLSRPRVTAEYYDSKGQKQQIEEVVALTLFRNTLGLLVPAKYVGRTASFERAKLLGFARMDDSVDTCGE